MAGRDRRTPWIVFGLVLLVAGALGREVWLASRPAEGPVRVAWDRQQCDRCRMLVSERGFAAQLHARSGDVLHFDDPGCLLLERESLGDAEARLWFHHAEAERWVSGDEVVFSRVETSPMAYGLAAHGRGEVDGLDLTAATAEVRERERARVDGRETADAR